MEAVFYISAVIAIVATLLALTRTNTVHALLYLIVSLMAVAVVFYTLGAPFVAALEVIIYAGAIVVLFLFVVMVLNLNDRGIEMERRWQSPAAWLGAELLALVLLVEMTWVVFGGVKSPLNAAPIGPKQVGLALFGPYLLGVEFASLLLLAGLIGAYHLGVRTLGAPVKKQERELEHDTSSVESSAVSGGDLVHVGADGPARTT